MSQSKASKEMIEKRRKMKSDFDTWRSGAKAEYEANKVCCSNLDVLYYPYERSLMIKILKLFPARISFYYKHAVYKHTQAEIVLLSTTEFTILWRTIIRVGCPPFFSFLSTTGKNSVRL